jgi:HAD superfamily hydrolase (TIGR01509 family)
MLWAAMSRLSRPPSLVIFDCDGVLVDSEMIFARILVDCLAAAEFPAATLEEALDLGFGKNRQTLAAAVLAYYGRPLPDGFFETMRGRATPVLERELSPMPGIEALLAGLPAARCVASNSHIDRVRHTLGVVGLLEHFEPHVYSASQVARGKPAPDLFLHAARRLEVGPEDCLVIEDSVTGLAAAEAAGMAAVGFCGGSHCRDGHAASLAAAGALRVFSGMAELARFLGIAKKPAADQRQSKIAPGLDVPTRRPGEKPAARHFLPRDP